MESSDPNVSGSAPSAVSRPLPPIPGPKAGLSPTDDIASAPVSRRGEPITVLPGWSVEQSKVYQDLNDRMAGVAEAFGSTIDPKNATPQQAKDGMRFVQGSPALLNMSDELKGIDESNMDPARKKQLAQDAYARVADLDAFVTDVQKRENITDRGIRMIPLLSEDQSKAYADRLKRVTSLGAGIETALQAQGKNVNPALNTLAFDYSRPSSAMASLPYLLADFAKENADPAKRAERVNEAMASLTTVDRQASRLELQLAGHEAEQITGTQQEAAKPGFLRRAFNAVQAFGNRVIDAISGKRTASPEAQAPAYPTSPAQNAKGEAKAPSTVAIVQQQYRDTALASHAQSPLGIRAGEAGSLTPVGNGFVVAGIVKEVGMREGTMQLDYEFRGREQRLSVDTIGRDGTPSPLSKAIAELKPADDFKFAVSRDPAGIDVVRLDNRTSGKTVDVRPTGIEPHIQPRSRSAPSLGL